MPVCCHVQWRRQGGGGQWGTCPLYGFRFFFFLVSSAVGHRHDNSPTPLWFFFFFFWGGGGEMCRSPPPPPPPATFSGLAQKFWARAAVARHFAAPGHVYNVCYCTQWQSIRRWKRNSYSSIHDNYSVYIILCMRLYDDLQFYSRIATVNTSCIFLHFGFHQGIMASVCQERFRWVYFNHLLDLVLAIFGQSLLCFSRVHLQVRDSISMIWIRPENLVCYYYGIEDLICFNHANNYRQSMIYCSGFSLTL